MSRTTTTNPVFYADRLRLALADDPERIARIFSEPDSPDLYTWNVFASLDTDPDREYVAGLLRPFCGSDLRGPVSLSLFSGRDREPLLHPSAAYVRHLQQQTAADGARFAAPIEAPVRIESPNVLGLVEVSVAGVPHGTDGRDRLIELIDAGAVHARRLGVELAVAVVYRSGSSAAATLSRRVNQLRDPAALRQAMPWAGDLPPVRLREVPLQQLVTVWEQERKHLRLYGQPAKAFLAHAKTAGLR